MLAIKQLSKRYGTYQALQNLTLCLQPGEIYGLLGPNGAGKTTTINLLSGLLKPDSGTVAIGNQPASAITNPLLGVMTQQNLLYQSLTCAENLAFFSKIYGLSRGERAHRVQDCLAAVNLSDRAKTPVSQLSGGMQRRLSLAVAIVHQPKLVVLDEPSTGLDIEARYEVWNLIRTLKQQGVTVLLTTHLLDEAERLCDRIGFIKRGQLLAEGTLAQLQERIPACEVVTIETSDEDTALVLAQQHGFTPRRYDNELAFWVPQPLSLKELIACFEDIPVNGITRSPVKLEHIYLEVTQD